MDISFEVVIHSLNVAVLGGGAYSLLKVVVPAGLSVRDSLRDTAKTLNDLALGYKDHEQRLRNLEYQGPERRK